MLKNKQIVFVISLFPHFPVSSFPISSFPVPAFTALCRVLATGFPKSDHVSNGITIPHVIVFGKTSCKNSANRNIVLC